MLIILFLVGNVIGTVNFNHRHGCQKCLVIGQYDKASHRMCFPDIDAERRTDQMFRQRTDPLHHKETSLFEELPINMISTFKVSDTLHLLHLGVMKKCIQRWIGKTKSYNRKWNKTSIESTSRFLLRCNDQMPSDIHRALRDLDTLAFWKGVEYRTILLYVGMVAFRSVLPNDEYEHFITLCCAVTICSCEKYKAFIPVAADMFKLYVKKYISLYGTNTIGSNIHNLIHITEEMIEHNVGNLDHLSTYKYENSLRLLGIKLKGFNKPLQQISRRLIEISNFYSINEHEYLKEEKFLPSIQYALPTDQNGCGNKLYSKINIGPGVFLSCRKKGDQWFLTRSGDVVKMKHAIEIHNTYKICGFSLIRKGAFFLKPLNSAKLNIFMSDGELNNEISTFDINAIAAKMICLESESNFVYIPILHSLEILSK